MDKSLESLMDIVECYQRNLKLESVMNGQKQTDDLFVNEQFVPDIMELNIKSANYLRKVKKYNDLMEKMKLQFNDILDLDEEICCDSPRVSITFIRQRISIYMDFVKIHDALSVMLQVLGFFGQHVVAHLKLIKELPDSLNPLMDKCNLSEPAASEN